MASKKKRKAQNGLEEFSRVKVFNHREKENEARNPFPLTGKMGRSTVAMRLNRMETGQKTLELRVNNVTRKLRNW